MFRKIKDFFSAILFGMKAGDELMTTSQSDTEEGSAIHKQVERKSVLQNLLRGEVTQEVEELRYETFKAEEMSNDYQYIGNGVAVKKKGDNHIKRRKFVQYNYDEEYSMHETLQMIENKEWTKNLPTRKIFKATYKSGVRFKLDVYAAKVKVELTDNSYKTYLYFIDDSQNNDTRPLVNFIKKTKKEMDEIVASGNTNKLNAYKKRNELFSELDSFSFKTINAENDVPNGIDYKFREATLQDIQFEDGYAVLVYQWTFFDGNILLSERFKSKSAEEKFEKKEKRKGYVPMLNFNTKSNEPSLRDRSEESLNKWFTDEETQAD